MKSWPNSVVVVVVVVARRERVLLDVFSNRMSTNGCPQRRRERENSFVFYPLSFASFFFFEDVQQLTKM